MPFNRLMDIYFNKKYIITFNGLELHNIIEITNNFIDSNDISEPLEEELKNMVSKIKRSVEISMY
ncbi:hypothetical protein C672_3657 [[Clostridium] bifermentans ATCC 638]|uniref:Uncharacterized protein n=1 Tax=Paraclostridium bifermentans ATCC 638 = DSM 14991 TaxID=1233171 RepID=T4VG99_PARBF|nr:hypothetical protein [Paraclostridium bifermentans]EQK39791.1 hypothetical protein C672_3657 [[Clostridium] bifermentans ATCC 638] [Paraclostridium bifermentans ATCC 638 = DSM 14991]